MAISVTQAFKDRHKAAVDTTLLKLEVNFTGVPAFPGAPVIVGGTWVDITEWAESASGTLEEVSQLGGGASANTMNLTLFNDDGRWSQRNTAGPYFGNLKPNRPMRASSVSGSESVRIFTGFSGAWPTQAKARTCQVAAQDAARILLRSDITEETVFNPSALTTGYYLTKILERAAWLAGWRWDTVNTKTDTDGNSWAFSDHDGTAITVNKSGGAAVATYTYGGTLVMQLDLVDLLIPVAPLKGKALAVLDQLAKVVDGKVYFGSQGQLVFRCPMYRNDSTLVSVETFDVDNLDDLIADQNYENSRFSQVVNHAEVTSTPFTFKLDASGAAQEEEVPFKGDLFARYHFNAGESYPGSGDADLWCELPNGLKIAKTASYPTAANVILETNNKDDFTKPGTGLKFKSGFPVFEQGRMKVAFENVGTAAEVIKTLTLKARLMRQIQRCRAVRKNQASIDTYDKRDWTYNNDLIPSAASCENLAAWKVEDGREPKLQVTLPAMYGLPWMEINDRITASETITKSLPVAEDFIVKRIKWNWALAGIGFVTEACSLSPNFAVGALPATAVKVETSNQNMNGAQSAMIPPVAIDGSQTLVGLDNIQETERLVNGVKRFSFSPAMFTGSGVLFDGADIFATDGAGQTIFKVNPLTGALIGSLSAGYDVGSMSFARDASRNKLIFVSAGSSRLLVFNSETFAAVATKADLGVHVPGAQLCVGGKLYLLTRSMADSLAYLNVWNSISSTRQDTPDTRVTLHPDAVYNPAGITTDGKRLYIGLHNTSIVADSKIATYDLTAGTLNNNAVAAPAEGINSLVHDGRALWAVGSDGNKVYRYAETAGGQLNRDLTITLDTAGSANPGALIFDGTYLWVNRSAYLDMGYLAQISTSGQVIAKFQTKYNGQVGRMAFDGLAIWAACADEYLYRSPRIVTGRQF